MNNRISPKSRIALKLSPQSTSRSTSSTEFFGQIVCLGLWMLRPSLPIQQMGAQRTCKLSQSQRITNPGEGKVGSYNLA